MEIVNAKSDNLASVLMGKNIQFPWRGQRNVIISVPYVEWLKFIKKYKSMLQYRKPLDYQRMLSSEDEGIRIRYFMYDISWALYSELALSSNIGKDATLILPHFDGGKNIGIVEAVRTVYSMTDEEVQQRHNSLKAVTRNYYGLCGDTDLQYGLVDTLILSEWNTLVFNIVIYLQSRSSKKIDTEKLNIDWRI